jgi:signal transduction histidine kinase
VNDVTHPARSWSRLRPLSGVVLFVAAALAVAACFVTRHVVADQEHKLLKQRTDEASLYLSSALTSIQGTFGSLAAATAGDGGTQAFVASANLAVKVPNSFTTIALISTKSSNPQVLAFGGKDMGDLGAARVAAVQKAASTERANGLAQLAPTSVFKAGGPASHVGFAYAAPGLPDQVVYAEFDVHPEVSSPATSGAPFSELEAAVYAGPRVDANQLILSSAPVDDVPLRGDIASAKSAVGVGSWFLVAKAKHPLVGSVAVWAPWLLLAGGLLAAILATGIVETLSRRREYALGLVAIRTQELERSLTDLAAAHEQLVRQERLAAIGELASTVGHELRNPLGVINNAVYLLRNDFGPEPSEAALRHLTTAEREVSAATVIVSDLLEFARQRQPVIEDVDVTALAHEVFSVMPPPAGVTVSLDTGKGPLVVPADRDMIRQVLINLIGNGYQAMPDGGALAMQVEGADSYVRLRVRDTGTGMTDEVRARLFEPFFTTKARGVGLGLAVSRRIVDAHGGDISVDSTVDVGTEFTVVLPVIVAPRVADSSESRNHESRSSEVMQ